MSLYDELGGAEALAAALDRFYEKVMADPKVNVFFEGMNVEQIKNKQKKFWAIALGGEAEYDGRNLNEAHQYPREMGLTEELFHRFVGHFRSTLEEFEVPEEKIEKVISVTDKHMNEVLNRSTSK